MYVSIKLLSVIGSTSCNRTTQIKMTRGLKNHSFTVLKPLASIRLCLIIVIIFPSLNGCFANEMGWTSLPDRITRVSDHGHSMSGHHVRTERSTQVHNGGSAHLAQSIGRYESASSSTFIYGGLVGWDRVKRNININILSNLPLGEIIRANAGQHSPQVRRSSRRDPRFPR